MCPHCGHTRSMVCETRQHNGEIYRRRRCLTAPCQKTYYTREVIVRGMPKAVNDAVEARLAEAHERRRRGEDPAIRAIRVPVAPTVPAAQPGLGLVNAWKRLRSSP